MAFEEAMERGTKALSHTKAQLGHATNHTFDVQAHLGMFHVGSATCASCWFRGRALKEC